jgi:GAF domain-containing protein
MPSSAAKQSVATVDSLLDGLMHLAGDKELTTDEFYSAVVQVVETLVPVQWVAVVAYGSDRQAVFLQGTSDAKTQFAAITQRYPRIDRHDEALDWSEIVEQTPTLAATEIKQGNRVWGWLVAESDGQRRFQSVQLELLKGVAQIADEFLATQKNKQTLAKQERHERLERYKIAVHGSLDSQHVAHVIANEGRWLVNCDRVSVLIGGNAERSLRLVAVSSVASVDSKSEFARSLTSLTKLAIEQDAPLASDAIFDQQTGDAVQCVNRQLAEYQKTSGYEFVFGLPLATSTKSPVGNGIDGGTKSHSRKVGYLVFESSHEIDRARFAEFLRPVTQHAAAAIANATTFEAVPLRKSLSWLGNQFRFSRGLKWGLAAAAFVAFLALMIFVQLPFQIRVAGELLPRQQQPVFAEVNGEVASIHVEHGQHVRAGQKLATLRSTELDAEIQRVVGESAKTQQLIDSKKILLNQYGHGGDQILAGRLAAEVSDLGFQIEVLQEEEKFLAKKQANLKLLSPIDGKVTTWRPSETQLGKPVKWGDEVLAVADLDGDWDVVLKVPERRVGYLMEHLRDLEVSNGGQQQSGFCDVSELKVSVDLFLKSDPGAIYQAEIAEVSTIVEIDPVLGPVTTIRCEVPVALADRRDGATVLADIECGQRPMWFVGFGEFVDGLRRNWVR